MKHPQVRLLQGPFAMAVVAVGVIAVGMAAAQVLTSTPPGPSPAANVLPPAKQTIQAGIDQARQQSLKAPLPAKSGYHPPESPTDPPWPSGIIENGQAPFRASQYTFQNVWQDVVDGEHVQVFAGALHDDPSQGVVVVLETSLDLHTKSGPTAVVTPTKSGSVRIISVSGVRLTLTTSAGTQFVFDASQKAFVGL